MKYYLCSVVIVNATVMVTLFYCNGSYGSRDVEQLTLFATKTRYNFTKSKLVVSEPNCKLLQVNSIFRHGIRNPGKKDITRSYAFHNNIERDSASIDQLIPLFLWTPKFVEGEEKDLSKAGLKEMHSIGQSYSSLFKVNNLPQDVILFQSSETNRTISSCVSFFHGFNDSFDPNVWKECHIRNDLMRFFDKCKKYEYEIERSDDALKEVKLFRRGKEIELVTRNVMEILKLNKQTQVSYKELKAIYTLAGVEVANFGESPWKSLFNTEDLKILEYTSDLKSYWKKSYGHAINYEQSCPLLANIFKHLDNAVNSQQGYYRGIFRFGHAETILPITTILGLFKDDEPLRADNYEQQKNRKFRTGRISPFGANVAFLLYTCSESHKLVLLHNEMPIYFPCCPDTYMCPYDRVRQYYKKWIDNCHFSKMCAYNDEL